MRFGVDLDQTAMDCDTEFPWQSMSHFYRIISTLPLYISKNKTWIFMEISCHRSMQLGPNWHQIPRLLHVIYLDLICFPCGNVTWILDKFKSWNFLGICQENDGVSIGFGLIFDQTAVKKTWEKPCHISNRKMTFCRCCGKKCQLGFCNCDCEFNKLPVKIWQGFSHVFLTAVWSKLRPNPMEIPSFS